MKAINQREDIGGDTRRAQVKIRVIGVTGVKRNGTERDIIKEILILIQIQIQIQIQILVTMIENIKSGIIRSQTLTLVMMIIWVTKGGIRRRIRRWVRTVTLLTEIRSLKRSIRGEGLIQMIVMKVVGRGSIMGDGTRSTLKNHVRMSIEELVVFLKRTIIESRQTEEKDNIMQKKS